MRHWVVALGACLLCAAAVAAQAGTGERAAKNAAAAQSMYRTQEVVGTIMAAHKMYTPEEGTWWDLDLRVDSVEPEDAKSSAGEVIQARYASQNAERRGGPVPGSQIQVALQLDEASGETVWSVVGEPKAVGRGEFVKPGEGPVEDLGSRDAKLLIKAFLQLGPECHEKTMGLLRELVDRHPGRVRVQIFNMRTRTGRMEMNRERLRCATVLINNRDRFVLSEGDKERQVELSHKPNDPRSTYNSEDVITIAEREIKRLYPADEAS